MLYPLTQCPSGQYCHWPQSPQSVCETGVRVATMSDLSGQVQHCSNAPMTRLVLKIASRQKVVKQVLKNI